MKQSREVIEKIEDLKRNSPNLEREISDLKSGQNDSYIIFHNGSWIKTVAGSENARSKRANIIVVDEYRMVDLEVINKVLRKFLTAPRSPKYLNKPEYRHLKERNKEFYMSSCWFKSHWAWEKTKAYFKSMIEGRDYFLCSLPYQLAIKEDLLMREQVEDEMSESDFSSIGWMMEMEALFYGESEKAYFKIKELQNCRKELKAFYPPTNIELMSSVGRGNKKIKQIPKQENEIRLIGVDIALMGGSTNDNTIFTFMRLLPNGDEYIRQVLYVESMSGEHTEDVAIRTKRLFYDFECDYCVLDTAGSGIGVYDSLCRILFDRDRDKEYPSWTCLNDDEKMKDRSNDPNALPVIYSVKASSEFNHKIATNLKTCFEKKKIKLLVSEIEAKDYLIEHKDYIKKEYEEQNKLLAPYIQTTLLINEIVNLEAEFKNGYIKLSEVGRARKDRYSSLAYTNYFASILEKDLISYEDDSNFEDYLFL